VTMLTNNETPQQTWKRFVDQADKLVGIKPAPAPVQAPIPIIAPAPKRVPVVPVLVPKPALVVVPQDPVAWLRDHKERWPKEVILLEPTKFPVVYEGRDAGFTWLPRGNSVEVVSIEGDTVNVLIGETPQPLPIKATNLAEIAKDEMNKPVPPPVQETPKTEIVRAPVIPSPQPASLPTSPFGTTENPGKSAFNGAFVHPGIPFTLADLEMLKNNLGREPWKSGYETLLSQGQSSLDYKMQGPFEHVSRNPHLHRDEWIQDMSAVWNLSRLWYFTKNEAYAQKAHDILLAWASTQKDFTGIESNLDLGDWAFRYVGSAEILRYTWPGWTQDDTDSVKNLFENVYWPAIGGNEFSIGPANKGTLTLSAGTAIAVFCDDRVKFNHMLYLLRTTASCALPNTLSSGEIGETGRDQGHCYGQWMNMAMAAEIFWKQGIDVYGERDNRLLAVGEYYARFHCGVPTPFIDMADTDTIYLANNGEIWPHGLMGMNMIHAAYVLRKGLISPYLERRRKELPGDADSFMFDKSEDASTAVPPPPIVYPPTTSVTTGMNDQSLGGANGSSDYSNGTWTVKGSGTTIETHDEDSCHFTYKVVEGDCAIIAKVTSIENTGINPRAGVMIRSSLDADAQAKAWVAMTPKPAGDYFMHGWTGMYAGSNWEKKSSPTSTFPYWVKIERLGDMISLYTSEDGTSWGAVGAAVFGNLEPKAYLGLVVCSSDDSKTNTSTFTDVQITGGDGQEVPHIPAAPFAVYASPGEKAVPIRWLGSSGADSYNVKRAYSDGGPFDTIATVKSTSYVDTNVMSDQTFYYTVSAVNSAGESSNAPEDTVKL